MLVYVYNPSTNRIEKSTLSLNDNMPYTTGKSLTVDEFRGSSKTTLVWSDKRFFQTWTNFRRYYGKPIYVGYCFKRIWEGGHGNQSQHYAGGAFDTGQNLTSSGRRALHSSALSFGQWSYVEPISMTPTWVHFDKRLAPSACSRGGYITVKEGSRGVYVLILQDALNALGYTGGGLDGIFGSKTKAAVRKFQADNYLVVDGIVGCGTWTEVTAQAVGIGKTATVVNP